jgi:hypothetical protein
MTKDVKIGMTYDGPADTNPFMPKSGDTVALCPHEPRPLHVQFYIAEDRPVVEGVAVRWLNHCRGCGVADVSSAWKLCVWPGKDKVN